MQTIYIGVSSRRHDLQRNRIYTDRPVELIDKLKTDLHPLIDKLFVPVDGLNDAQNAIVTAGTPLNAAYNKLIEVLKVAGRSD